MNRRSFFLKTLQATAAGILVPEHLLKGRSMVSLCGIDPVGGGTFAWGTANDLVLYGIDLNGKIKVIQNTLNELHQGFFLKGEA